MYCVYCESGESNDSPEIPDRMWHQTFLASLQGQGKENGDDNDDSGDDDSDAAADGCDDDSDADDGGDDDGGATMQLKPTTDTISLWSKHALSDLMLQPFDRCPANWWVQYTITKISKQTKYTPSKEHHIIDKDNY